MSDYFEYTVITKIENINENPMAFPAVTLCLAYNPLYSTNASLEDSLLNCTINEAVCDIKDFYSFEIRTSYDNAIITCHVLNGGRNSSGHLNKIKNTWTTLPLNGIVLQFYLPNDHFLFYYINDAYVNDKYIYPTKSEINKFIIPGKNYEFVLEKSVETKLEYPFNKCWNRINLPDTPLVGQLSAANITYRQVNCFEICFENFVQHYALEHNISEDEARLTNEVQNFDMEKNCNKLCPLECESTQYKILQSFFSIAENREYSSQWIPVVKKKLNKTINSTDEFNKHFLDLYVYFDSLKYTKISQTPKTSLSALVSNLGGSFGLFMDLSFLSACRAIEYILGIILKF